MPRAVLQLVPGLSIGTILMTAGGLTPAYGWLAPVGALMVTTAIVILFAAVARQQREREELRGPPSAGGKHAEPGAAVDRGRKAGPGH